MNTFGQRLRLTTFGESHGPAMGGVLDGVPPRFKIDFEALQKGLDRRRPGQSTLTTARNEADRPEFLSGLTEEGVTLGTPIGFIVRNGDKRSSDYSPTLLRPNHADYTYMLRYGIRDHRGGGRASARETVNWCVGGEIARQLLATKGIAIQARLISVGGQESGFEEIIAAAKKNGDSVGAIVGCVASGVPGGIGDPVFGKLHARLAQAMMSINAAKGFDYGLGFEAANQYGSNVMDLFQADENGIHTATNYSGGIQGGISNGQDIWFRVAFKPTPTLLRDVLTVDIEGEQKVLKAAGRHDPCVGVRAVPVVEAMTALTIADAMLCDGVSFT